MLAICCTDISHSSDSEPGNSLGATGPLTKTSMLEDLDSLAARIGQMAQFTRQLQAERSALQARLGQLEQERNALRDQLARQQADQEAMAQQVRGHSAELEAARTQADALRADYHKVVSQLQTSQSQSNSLRTAARAAQERIDAVLMRLPGATQE